MLTVKQLINICNKNEFILLRFKSGYQMAINCKVSNIALKRCNYRSGSETAYVSYKPCNFMEYISNKHPFQIS